MEDAEYIDTLYNEAFRHYRQGKFDEALHRFEQVLQYNPNHYETNLYKEICIEKINDNSDEKITSPDMK